MISLKRVLKNLLKESTNPETIKKIEKTISRFGGESFIVGGAVRDEMLGIASKDVDFLITGMPLEKIEKVLSSLGKVSEVGKSFGIVKAMIDGEEFDFAIPRTAEVKTGARHGDFSVKTDPNASPKDDLGRRDFTINALAKDRNGKILDLFGGVDDLKKGLIRTVGNPSDRFNEDPLRMLRALQFASRFGFKIEEETVRTIKALKSKLSTLPAERILQEFVKAWTKSKDVEIFISSLEESGVGKFLFGNDFNPVPVNIKGNEDQKKFANFIAFFVNGGDEKKLKPDNEMLMFLAFARSLMSGKDLFQLKGIKSNREKIDLLKSVFDEMHHSTKKREFRDVSERIKNSKDLPISADELKLTGGDLMNMGLKGKQIGAAQNHLMTGVYSRKVRNDKEDLLRFLNHET